MLASIIKINGYSPFKALILREYWENRRAIIYTPLVITAVLMVLIVISMGLFGRAIHINNESFTLSEVIANLSSNDAQAIKDKINHFLLISAAPIMIGVWFSMVFTALSMLYDERKDNSILFWKSMPVSDFQTVMSKLLTVMVIMPLVALGFAFIFKIFLLIVASFATIGTDYNAWNLIWSHTNLLSLMVSEVLYIIMYSLWALPVFAWLMFASVIAKRTPLLIAILPVALIAVAEGLFLRSQYVMEFFGSRLSGAHILGGEGGFTQNFTNIDPMSVTQITLSVSNPNLWIGFGITAIVLYGVIFFRKRNVL